jgi:hypothetical protein
MWHAYSKEGNINLPRKPKQEEPLWENWEDNVKVSVLKKYDGKIGLSLLGT